MKTNKYIKNKILNHLYYYILLKVKLINLV